MKTDLGFIILSLEENPIHHQILYAIKQLIDKNPYKNICVFNHECYKIDTLNVPLLHIKQAKFFYGSLFIFDIVGLMLAKDFPNLYEKYFYAATIPWETNRGSYKQWKDIFDQDNLNIICQNQKIYDIYDMCWNKPLGIAENFNYDKIQQFI
jgi:hypothetical protein